MIRPTVGDGATASPAARVLATAGTGKEEGMRASTDQVRDLTHDVVDGARRRASGAVSHGADRVVTTLDGAASTIGDGVDRLAERAPMLSVAAPRPKRRHRVRTVLIASVVLVVILAVARKLLSDEPQEVTAGPPSDDATMKASSNGDRLEGRAAPTMPSRSRTPTSARADPTRETEGPGHPPGPCRVPYPVSGRPRRGRGRRRGWS